MKEENKPEFEADQDVIKKKASLIKTQMKKNEDLFCTSKNIFSQQIFSTIHQIQLTYFSVAIIAIIDLIIQVTNDKEQQYILINQITQLVVSLSAIILLNKLPEYYSSINSICCVIIHTAWALQQIIPKYTQIQFPMAYAIGMLSFIMISNSSSLRMKYFLVIFNITLFCAFRDISLEYLHYIILIVFTALYAILCEERGRDILIREFQWIFGIKNELPQSLIVVEYDREQKEIHLRTINEKARNLFNLGTDDNFNDFCHRVTIQKLFGKRQLSKSGRSKINDSLFYLDEESQGRPSVQNKYSIHQSEEQSTKEENLSSFLQNRIKRLEESIIQRDLKKQPSLQSQDKKSTKTNLFMGTSANMASKSFFAKSKTILKMLTSQKFNKKMIFQHTTFTSFKKEYKKGEEYRFIYRKPLPQIQSQNENETVMDDLHFIMRFSIYSSVNNYFIIMSIEESTLIEQDKRNHSTRQSFFFEEFCKQSLLKSAQTAVEVVQELKNLTAKSSVITEVEFSRFVGSNLYSGSNLISGGGDSALSNNLKLQGSTTNIISTQDINKGNFIANPLGFNKGIYCIPKRQLDNVLQTSVLANTVISNFVNFFALKNMDKRDIDQKLFSILKVIRNVQRIFQRMIDKKQISIFINQHQDSSDYTNQRPVPQPSILVPQQTPAQNHLFSQNVNLSSNANITQRDVNASQNNPLNSNNSFNPNLLNNFSPTPKNFNSNKSNSFSNVNNQINQVFQISSTTQLHQQQQPAQQQQQQIQPQSISSSMINHKCDEIKNDESMLQHLIFNLFKNAVENTPQFGTIAFQIQRDQERENCIKIRIRNTCEPDLLFPFSGDQEIIFDWENMLDEFEESGNFYFGTRMASQLSSLIGPYNSLFFKDMKTNEIQVEFLVFDYSIATPLLQREGSNFSKSECRYSFDEKERKNYQNQSNSNKMNSKMKSNSLSSYQIRLESCDSFDKWIKIQSLEQQKAQNTIRIRNQLKFKN